MAYLGIIYLDYFKDPIPNLFKAFRYFLSVTLAPIFLSVVIEKTKESVNYFLLILLDYSLKSKL